MRRFLSFDCADSTLYATLDDAEGSCGLLVVSGGNEIRCGAHAGMAALAADLSAAGYPVLRFDRRGIGDSEGENGGFESSAPDLTAAIETFRTECPHVKHIVAFGNCDAATALLLHQPDGLAALVISNIWVIEPVDDLPPAAAIKSHYIQRLKDPRAWASLLSGAVDVRKIVAGLRRVIAPPPPSALTHRVAAALAAVQHPAHILLARHDGTALAFAEAWASPAFERARQNARIKFQTFDSSAHSFARKCDYAVLRSTLLQALRGD